MAGTTHDSTLSSVSFAIAAARLGDEAAALDFMRECAFVDLEDRHGNTSSTSHFVVLDDYLRQGKIRAGDRVLMLVLASGIIMGVVAITVGELGD